MSISDPFIEVTCDNCKKVTRIEVISHEHRRDTERRLAEIGWYIAGKLSVESKHYCPKCH